MAQPKIVLHQWLISPFCGKIRKVLAFKGLDYEVVEYSGLLATKVKGLSPAGKLPVLDIDGERFQDSTTIAHALDTRFPNPPLLPSRPGARHMAHLLEDWADEALYWIELWARFCDPVARDRAARLLCEGRPDYERVIVKMVTGRYAKAVVTQGLGRYSDADVLAKLREHLVAIDGLLAGGPWLTGDEPSIADLAVSAQLDEFKRTSQLAHELDAHARLGEWLSRCQFARAT